MPSNPDSKNPINLDQIKERQSHCAKVWGYEGCGAMWTFFYDSKQAIDSARGEEVHEFSIEDAFILDNNRRAEMGFEKITFEQFLECLSVPTKCQVNDTEC